MTRLLGFLSGLLLVIALAFVVLRYPPDGLPGDWFDEGVASADRAAAQAEPARERAAQPTRQPTRQPTQRPNQRSAPEAAEESTTPPAPVEMLPRVDDPPPAPAAEFAAGDGDDAGEDPAATDAGDTDEPGRQWHAFWQPFHSEISAAGFRRRLEGVTGLDYRVVSPRPGEYQVAFAYRDEAERQENLAAIEAATGLVLRSQML